MANENNENKIEIEDPKALPFEFKDKTENAECFFQLRHGGIVEFSYTDFKGTRVSVKASFNQISQMWEFD